MFNYRTSRVETLLDALDIDPKLKALGVVEINGNMIYVAYDY
ncbi:MAG TPA: hypothetical protein VJ836_01810 [Candidatus Saccharimonadales bacterium]|nr:hypothetical protein [Candidatus Saccharimonadales bacterium]